MIRLLALVFALAAASPAMAVELLFPAMEAPVRLELRVSIDGQPVTAAWDKTFGRLVDLLDRNRDGGLAKTEAARLPSPFALRQILWGQFSAYTGDAPSFVDLDANADGQASVAEVAACYRRAGLGDVLVGIGRPPGTASLTAALLKGLDANGDSRVEPVEWKAAAEALARLDTNDDQLIGPGELVAKAAYPGAVGSIWMRSSKEGVSADPIVEALPFLVLTALADDSNWKKLAGARRESAKLAPMKFDEIKGTTWHVRLGGDQKEPALQAEGNSLPENQRLVLSAAEVRLELRSDAGKLKDQATAARKHFQALFAECDHDGSGNLEAGELTAPKSGTMQQLSSIADQNGDGTLSAAEFTAWLDLQQQIASVSVLLTVLDHGAGLFELLDADHDGSLSVPELRLAWQQVSAANCLQNDTLDAAKLPRQLIVTVSHGHPQSALGKPHRTGPAWFLAMDRNGDGVVSAREWVGDLKLLQQLDTNSDRLLSAQESLQADR